MAGLRLGALSAAALALGCASPKAGAPLPDSAGTGLLGDSPAADSAEPERYAPLSTEAAWQSLEEGVATGLGWVEANGDGRIDLVIAYGNDISPGPIALHHRPKEGLWPAEASWESESRHYHGQLSLGDLNGDSLPDLAVSRFIGDGGFDEPGGLDIYLGDGEAFTSSPVSSLGPFYTFSQALGDVDRDGDLDLAVAVGEPYEHGPAPSLVYLNDGEGGFGPEPDWQSEEGLALDAAWADLDGDGWLDLALARVGLPHAWWRNEGGRLASSPAWLAPGEAFEGNTVDFGDVDADGHMDLAISDNLQLGGPGRVRIYCGPEHQVCWEGEDKPDYQSALSLEDVDGDGRLDLVAGAWWGSSRIYLRAEAEQALPDPRPSWFAEEEGVVVEAYAWADPRPEAEAERCSAEGEGILRLPHRPRVFSVEGGVAGDGYITGPGPLRAEFGCPSPRWLAVTDWRRVEGSLIYRRASGLP